MNLQAIRSWKDVEYLEASKLFAVHRVVDSRCYLYRSNFRWVIPLYNIYIAPTLQLENLVPFPMTFKLVSNCNDPTHEEGTISPLGIYSSYDQPVLKGVLAQIQLENFAMTPLFVLPPSKDVITILDAQGTPLMLRSKLEYFISFFLSSGG